MSQDWVPREGWIFWTGRTVWTDNGENSSANADLLFCCRFRRSDTISGETRADDTPRQRL